MNRKTVVQFIGFTFLIRLVFGGGLVLCEQLGFMMSEYPLLNLPFFISAWSPAIASFVVLRKSKQVSSLKEWLKHIFAFKTSGYNYLCY